MASEEERAAAEKELEQEEVEESSYEDDEEENEELISLIEKIRRKDQDIYDKNAEYFGKAAGHLKEAEDSCVKQAASTPKLEELSSEEFLRQYVLLGKWKEPEAEPEGGAQDDGSFLSEDSQELEAIEEFETDRKRRESAKQSKRKERADKRKEKKKLSKAGRQFGYVYVPSTDINLSVKDILSATDEELKSKYPVGKVAPYKREK